MTAPVLICDRAVIYWPGMGWLCPSRNQPQYTFTHRFALRVPVQSFLLPALAPASRMRPLAAESKGSVLGGNDGIPRESLP